MVTYSHVTKSQEAQSLVFVEGDKKEEDMYFVIARVECKGGHIVYFLTFLC